MARAKKEAVLTPEERLQAALVPDWEWPYKLPENWCWTNWGECGEFVAGSGFKNEYQGFTNYDIPFYKVSSLKTANETGYLCDNTNTVDETVRKKLKAALIPANSLLFAKIGEAIRLNRRAISTVPCCVDNNMMAFIPIICQLKYAFYWSKGIDLYDFTNATTVPAIRKTDLEKISFPLAPLAEQQRIVDRIESLFTKLDEAKEKAQAVVDSFETRKAAILHKAFTGELTAKWREEHYATDNTVLMDIKNYSSSWSAKEKDLLSREQAKSEVVVLDNGHEWIRCTIGAVGRVTNGSTPLRKEPKYWSGKIPWISSGEVRNNIIESSNECISEEGYANSSVKLLPIGTVLIAMIGEGKTRGQSAILSIEATINQNVAAIVVEHNCVLPYYIWYWLQMNYAKNREKGSGSGPQALNCQRVRELDFFVPNLKEQKEVVNILRKALAKEQQSKEAAEAVLDQIDLMKKSILARAFRGELGTNDPNEESAVELLKQII